MKAVIVIMDGVGDRPIKELGEKTPLEVAESPNLDEIARTGITGLIDTIAPGIAPGSDTSHLSIFGLDPQVHYHGRGPLEVLGVKEIQLEHGDVALRANLGTVDDDLRIVDRRAGRIETTEPLCKVLDGMTIDDAKVILKPSAWYRAAFVLRGKGLSDRVGPNDPKKVGERILEVKPLDNSKEAKRTAGILNEFTKLSYEKLKELPFNKNRTLEGKLPGNMVLFRGAGTYVPAPTLQEKYGMKSACIAGGGLYKGVGRYLGMDVIDVPGATGRYDSDFGAKVRALKDLKDKYDFFFVHMKATDSAAEDGNYELKIKMIENMDKALGGLLDFDGLLVVTGDHTTPCSLKKHSYEPVPVAMRGEGIRVDDVKAFDERSCAKGALHRIKGLDLMPMVAYHMGFSKLYGA
ncbi:MAG: 2,3-bisphosphoglycerate-independent phosphoglycerate mutase [Candidatus Altiarchaeota archaeon]|nr:2,3-bisphosphoglycerate-independent phosphoglycerate mutase [Candidatus Altiarchaeota archaeon]